MNKKTKIIFSGIIVAISLLLFLFGNHVGYDKGYNKCLIRILTSTAGATARELIEMRQSGAKLDEIKVKEQFLQVTLLKILWNSNPKEFNEEEEQQWETISFVKRYRTRFAYDKDIYMDTNSVNYFYLSNENGSVSNFLSKLPVYAREKQFDAYIQSQLQSTNK